MRNRQLNPAFFRKNENDNNSVGFKVKFKAARAGGTLNLSSSIPPLQLIPKEVFQLDAHIEEDEKFWEVVPLASLDVSFNKITMIQPEIGNLADCTSLKARNNLIQSLPDSLFTGCVSMRHLDLDSNRISTVSESVDQMINLRDLIMSNNCLQYLPGAVFNIISLRHLEVQNNQLTSLSFPQTSQNLDQPWRAIGLAYLNVSGNKLTQLPDCISSLRSLEVLYCQGNALRALPDLSLLRCLKYLDASQNHLTTFPTLPRPTDTRSQAQFKSSLVHVYVGYNRISALDLAALCTHSDTLCELLVHNNQLTELSPEVELLQALKVLDISNNTVRDLPAGLGWMSSLQRLKADGNPLKTIRQLLLTKPTNELKMYLRTRGPSILGVGAAGDCDGNGGGGLSDKVQFRLRDITAGVLDLSSLGLSALPEGLLDDLAALPAYATLHTVNLEGNQLVVLPTALATVPTLRALLLGGNRLEDCGSPGSSNLLSPVALLDVSRNRLGVNQLEDLIMRANSGDSSNSSSVSGSSRRPAGHVNRTLDGRPDASNSGLTELLANNNAFPYLPASINRLVGLRVLRLAYCGLQSIDELDLSALRSLETLDVSNNKLESLAESLLSGGDGSRLEYLSVENNCLQEIPPQLAHLACLKVLLVGGNPQRTVRPLVVQQGSVKVIEALRNKLSDRGLPLPGGPVGYETVFRKSSAVRGGISPGDQWPHPTSDSGRSVAPPRQIDNSRSGQLAASSHSGKSGGRPASNEPSGIGRQQADIRAKRQVLAAVNKKRFTNPNEWNA